MGNSVSRIHEEQMKNINDKLHKSDPNLSYDKETVEKITNMKALRLQEDLFNNKYTLPEIFKIFHYKKMLENNEHRSFADVLYNEPLQQALDTQRKLDTEVIKKEDLPLLGFVMSIKDSLRVKNTASTCGMFINAGILENEHSETVQLLINKGALITCKGNVPQALFAIETISNIFGCATNLYNPLRSVGGSSGGDASLVALKCVNAAIGSDIGGSCRIPALYCGIVGFKPTVNRISSECFGTFYGKHKFGKAMSTNNGIIRATIGPMASNVSDTEALMKVLIEGYQFDPSVPPLPWRNISIPKKVGIFWEFDQLEVSPANKRALRVASEILEQEGIEVVPLNLDSFYEDILILTFASYYKEDVLLNTFTRRSPIKEPLIKPFKTFAFVLRMPHFLIRYMANKNYGDRLSIYFKGLVKSRSINTETLGQEIGALLKRFRNYMNEKGVQMMLAPGMCTPAVYHESSNENSIQAIYTFMFNLLECPVGALPITRVMEDEQYYETKYNDTVAKSLENNMKDSKGLPLGIQVAAMPWMDEYVFELMKLIERRVQFK